MNAGNVGGGDDDGLDDLTQDELFEEKLRETIDMASQKSANGKKYRFDIRVVGSTVRPRSIVFGPVNAQGPKWETSAY